MRTPLDSDAPGHLLDEALLFSRYLAGREAEPEIIDRYARGCQTLFTDEPNPPEAAVLAFVHRYGWSLPFLDAACSLVSPDSLLRGRLLLMLSILETTPRHAGLFMAKPRGRVIFLFLFVGRCLTALLKAAGGLLLMPVARMTRMRRPS